MSITLSSMLPNDPRVLIHVFTVDVYTDNKFISFCGSTQNNTSKI